MGYEPFQGSNYKEAHQYKKAAPTVRMHPAQQDTKVLSSIREAIKAEIGRAHV